MANRGRKHNPPVLSSDDQGGININSKLRQVGASNGPEYYNPNPWARILDTANETETEIDGKVSKALINSGAMILMMNKGHLKSMGMRYSL